MPDRQGHGQNPASVGKAPLLPRLLLYTLSLLTAVVVLVRRLNFDEGLALRAGWLLTEQLPGQPNFYMPFTLLVGSLAQCIADPGALFLVLRLLCLVSVLGVLAWALFESRLRRADAMLALVFILGHWTFLVHGFEFRYDWAILMGLVLAYGTLVRPGRARYTLLGALIAWLLAHHLKGVYFGALVYVATLLRMAFWDGFQRRALLRLHAAAAVTLGVWMAISALTGHWRELVGVYLEFFQVATDSEKVWPWTALKTTLVRDTAWWLAAATALVGLAWVCRRQRRKPRLDLMLAALFAMGAVGFWFVHPHPWPYMIALPVPFLALLLAEGLGRLWRLGHGMGRRRWGIAVAAVVVVSVLQAGLGYPPGGAFLAGIRAPMDDQVATLRALRQHARPGDRVMDPSGLAYFLPPVMEQWYLDTLFVERVSQGRWMAAEEITGEPGQWALLTGRLESLPEPLKRRMRLNFVPVGGALALSRLDPRVRADKGEQPLHLPLNHRRLESFW